MPTRYVSEAGPRLLNLRHYPQLFLNSPPTTTFIGDHVIASLGVSPRINTTNWTIMLAKDNPVGLSRMSSITPQLTGTGVGNRA